MANNLTNNGLTYNVSASSPIVAIAISPCGSYLAFNSDVSAVRILFLDVIRSYKASDCNINLNDTLQSIFEVNFFSPIRCIDFGRGSVDRGRLPHRTSKRRTSYAVETNTCLLAVGLQNGLVKIFSVLPTFLPGQTVVEGAGKAKLVLEDHMEDLTCVSFSNDGSLRLASASGDGKVRLWDMWDDGNRYIVINVANNFRPIYCAWGNKSRQICIVGSKGKGFIYQSEKPCQKIAALEKVHYNDISSCKYSSDESLLGTSSFDSSIVIWCAASFKPLLQIWPPGEKPSKIIMGGIHSKFIRDFAFSPDCVNLIVISDEGLVRFWNLDETRDPVEEIKIPFNGNKFSFYCAKCLPDGSKYVVSTSDGRLIFFDNQFQSPSLATLCRRTVRERLIYKLSGLSKNNTICFNNNNQPTSLLESQTTQTEKSCADMGFSGVNDDSLRRRSDTCLMYSPDINLKFDLSTVVEDLPIPGMLKSYLVYGLPGNEMIENSGPRRLRFAANRRASTIF